MSGEEGDGVIEKERKRKKIERKEEIERGMKEGRKVKRNKEGKKGTHQGSNMERK